MQNEDLSAISNLQWTEVAMRVDGDVYSGSDWMTYLGRVVGSEIEIRNALGNPYELADCWLKLGWFLKVSWDTEGLNATVGRSLGLLLQQIDGVWTLLPRFENSH